MTPRSSGRRSPQRSSRAPDWWSRPAARVSGRATGHPRRSPTSWTRSSPASARSMRAAGRRSTPLADLSRSFAGCPGLGARHRRAGQPAGRPRVARRRRAAAGPRARHARRQDPGPPRAQRRRCRAPSLMDELMGHVPLYPLAPALFLVAATLFGLQMARHLRVFSRARPASVTDHGEARAGSLVRFAIVQVRMFRDPPGGPDARGDLLGLHRPDHRHRRPRRVRAGPCRCSAGRSTAGRGGSTLAAPEPAGGRGPGCHRVGALPPPGGSAATADALARRAAHPAAHRGRGAQRAAWRRRSVSRAMATPTRHGPSLRMLCRQRCRPVLGAGMLEVGYAVCFWLNILLVCTFLAYLPRSKHLHIVTAFFNAAFRKLAPRGELPAMDLEAETARFGVKTIEDLSWKDLLDGFTCTECGRCQDACPAWATGKPLNPKTLIMGIRDMAVEAERGVPLLPFIRGGDGRRPRPGGARPAHRGHRHPVRRGLGLRHLRCVRRGLPGGHRARGQDRGTAPQPGAGGEPLPGRAQRRVHGHGAPRRPVGPAGIGAHGLDEGAALRGAHGGAGRSRRVRTPSRTWSASTGSAARPPSTSATDAWPARS